MSKSERRGTSGTTRKTKGGSKAIKKPSNGPCCVYDFTLASNIEANREDEIETIRECLKTITKKYCFQLEKGTKTGYLHYQGRFSLKEKTRQEKIIKILTELGWGGFHLSKTSTENRDNNFYVCKDESRVDGPFTDKNYVKLPRHVQRMKVLHKWQSKMKELLLNEQDDRAIHVVYDKPGNSGKSSFAALLSLKYKSAEIPFINDFRDVMRMAYCLGEKVCYLLDMPRAANKDKLYQLYSAIERLKSGYCYDDRYEFKVRYFDRPAICIFTNSLPDTTLLSKDMWNIWTIDENKDLVKYELPEDEVERKITEHFDEFSQESTHTKKRKATRTRVKKVPKRYDSESDIELSEEI